MVKVYVVNLGRAFYYLQWVDPATGKRFTRSSKEKTRRGAERKALELEAQLSRNRLVSDGSYPWRDFLNRYTTDHLQGIGHNSELKALSILDGYESAMRPGRIGDVNAAALAQYATKLRVAKRSEATIATHLRTIRAALGWAESIGMLATVPKIPRIQRAPGARVAKGRPITLAEFVAMLRVVRVIVGTEAARSWRRLLRGLWLSGLRLGEALSLRWDVGDHPSIDLTGAGWMVIPAASDKSHRDRRLPLTPDFAAWLARTPPAQRTGRVFAPLGERGRPVEYFRVTHVIADIGSAAKIVTDPATKRTATAHDLRRAFAQRWAARLSPVDLQRLMRHSRIETTLAFYLDADADGLASRLRQSTIHSTRQQENTSGP